MIQQLRAQFLSEKKDTQGISMPDMIVLFEEVMEVSYRAFYSFDPPMLRIVIVYILEASMGE